MDIRMFSRDINDKKNIYRIIYIACILIIFGITVAILIQKKSLNTLIRNISSSNEYKCTNCNVLLVSMDSCRARDIECYGYNRETMPNLCKLAERGTLFKNAFSNAHWTLPSHAAIFTGLYPTINKVNQMYDKLGSDTPLLPNILQENGYNTYFYSHKDDWTIPIDDVYYRGISQVDSDGHDLYGYKPGYIDKALQTLENNNKQGNKSFIFFHSYMCHDPYVIENEPKRFTTETYPDIPLRRDEIFYPFTEGFYQYLLKRIPEIVAYEGSEFFYKNIMVQQLYNTLLLSPQSWDNKTKYKHALASLEQTEELFRGLYLEYYYFRTVNPNNKSQMKYLQALYDQKLNLLDDKIIKKIYDTIMNTDLKQNTIILITADHGEEFGEHGQTTHKTLYDYNLQIPFVLYVPNTKPRTILQQVQSVDITPTLLDILNIHHSYSFNGVTLTPLLRGKPIGDRLLIAENYYKTGSYKAIRSEKWKLFVSIENKHIIPYELYDIDIDPNETINMLSDNLIIANNIIKDYIKAYPNYY